MFIFILFFMMLSMFIYTNTMYYSISLLLFSFLMLSLLLSSYLISPVLVGLFMIVYLGAMMVMIGYICAVCPNFYIRSVSGKFFMFLLLSFIILFFYPFLYYQKSDFFISHLFFYGAQSDLLILLALFLFLILILVTSQYLSPKGPFRSFTIKKNNQ